MKALDIILIGIIMLWVVLAIIKFKRNKCIGCSNKECLGKREKGDGP